MFLLTLWVQSAFHILPETPLTGYEPLPKADTLTLDGWSEGSWQQHMERAEAKTFGFRPAVVRLVNQLRYSFFNEHTDVLTRAEDGTLFENAYRNSVCGSDFIGDSLVEVRLDSLDHFQNYLASQGKKMVILITPNKWRTFSERVDWDCQTGMTNYEAFIPTIRHRGYAVCDAIDIFQYDQANEPEHALHSKQGTHWSIFGAALSLDYLSYAFAEEGIILPRVSFDTVEVVDEPRYTDKDLHDLLNVMLGPRDEELAYPKLSFSGGYKPKTLVIGDSYYWTYYYLGAHEGLFAPGSKFFYYNRDIYTDNSKDRTPLTDDLRLQALDEAEVVLLVMSEPSLARFGYDAFRLTPEVEQKD